MTSSIRSVDTRMVTAGAPAGDLSNCQGHCKGGFALGKDVFIDLATGRTLCDRCGPVLRYHRKKALERGEDMPLTFAEADARLNSFYANNAQPISEQP